MVINRRNFIKGMAGASALASLQQLGLMNALAAASEDYRALVCVFLFGGNDGNNTVIPIDVRYTDYAAIRGGIAIPQASVIPLNPVSGAATFGLHPSLAPLQAVWDAGALAPVFNVGPLVAPLTRAQYRSGAVPRPESLFSHSDQQQQWQTAFSTGVSRTGWAGRLADRMAAGNGASPLPVVISAAGSNLFATGNSTNPLAVPTSGTFGLSGFGTDAASVARKQALQDMQAQAAADAKITNGMAALTARAITLSQVVNPVLTGTSTIVNTAFTGLTSGISQQLKQIARLIEARASYGIRRQVFFASLGGFDTHDNQLAQQKAQLDQLGPALKAFYDATVALGVAENVTTFTMADFARTLQVNSGAGSDHAWGNHHLVMGGGVVGRQTYGTFPTLALGGADDTDTEGRWIPTLSIEQYGGTLASWFGVAASDLDYIFPNRNRFSTAPIGFMV